MNADHGNRGEQEGQGKAHVVAVVECAEQHGEKHQAKDQAASGWQDVDAALVQFDDLAVRSLAATAQRAERDRLLGNGDGSSDATALLSSGPASGDRH